MLQLSSLLHKDIMLDVSNQSDRNVGGYIELHKGCIQPPKLITTNKL